MCEHRKQSSYAHLLKRFDHIDNLFSNEMNTGTTTGVRFAVPFTKDLITT